MDSTLITTSIHLDVEYIYIYNRLLTIFKINNNCCWVLSLVVSKYCCSMHVDEGNVN